MYYHRRALRTDARASIDEVQGPAPAIGQAVPRREDRRLLTGTAEFLDDVPVSGALHVAFLRSPAAHARLRSADTAAAAAAPGVTTVITAADVDIGPLLPPLHNPEAVPTPRPLLADGRALRRRGRRRGGRRRPVCGRGRVRADRPRPRAARAGGRDGGGAGRRRAGRRRHPGERPLRLARWRPATSTPPSPGGRGRRAHVRQPALLARRRSSRAACSPRPRATASPSGRRPRRRTSSRVTTEDLLGLEPGTVRVVTPDVGGGFGQKAHVYPEEILVAWLALPARAAGASGSRTAARTCSPPATRATSTCRVRARRRRRRPAAGHRGRRRLRRRRLRRLPARPHPGGARDARA